MRLIAPALFTLVCWLVVPAPAHRTASAAGTLTIVSPTTEQVLTGSPLVVAASGAGASGVTYSIDGGPSGALSLDAASGLWRATVDIGGVSAGAHNVRVAGTVAGAQVSDTAWRVSFPGAGATSSAAGPPTITIVNPQSNQTYSRTITVIANAANASAVAYAVDGGARVAMDFDAGTGNWLGALDTTGLASGNHNVDVINSGRDGTSVTDRAWSVNFANAPTATPVPTPAPVQSSGAPTWGVNYSGAEFGTSFPGTLGTDYIYPADDRRNSYFASRGLRLIRLPISWERLQHQANGPLSQADVDGVRSVLDGAAKTGSKVIIDLHNFGRYYGTPLTVADSAKLANLWQQLAAALRGHPALYGYELMNEPHDMPEGGVGWAAIAQSAADGVRRSDMSAWILVPGYGWQTATYWAWNNPTLDVHDSANHLEYAAHLYFDADYSGQYRKSYDADGAYPGIGVDRVQPFLAWRSARNATGMLTEYGVPSGDTRWLTVLDNFLNVVWNNANIMGGTYSSAGPWWGAYPLSVEPVNGQDRPQVSILTRYRSK